MHVRHASGILIAVRWPDVALGSVLAVGAIGLTVAAVWIVGIPVYACDEGVSGPNDWVYAGFAFDFGGAIISHTVSGDTPVQMLPAVVCAALLAVSYVSRRSRAAAEVPA